MAQLREFPKRIEIEADVQTSMPVEKVTPAHSSQDAETVRLFVIVGNDGAVVPAPSSGGRIVPCA